jgi:8-oxo-dGTP diphosphatase
VTLPRVQRVAAYNVCLDARSRLLLCRLSTITERPGWWTLPGGGIDFGEHPEAGALRELTEETGLVGRIVGLLAVDSLQRVARADDGVERDYHSVRIVYRTEIVGGALRHETDESTDRAQWCAREDVGTMPLVEMGRLGLELADACRPDESSD